MAVRRQGPSGRSLRQRKDAGGAPEYFVRASLFTKGFSIMTITPDTITPDMTVAAIATAAPATIHVFQEHEIDFCCGGKIPLSEACRRRGLDVLAILSALRSAVTPVTEQSWSEASLTALVRHIQGRYHEPLRAELPRLSAMLEKVVSRHGEHLPERLLPLQETFRILQRELLAHMEKEDRVLFPAIVALEPGDAASGPRAAAWIQSPIAAMEAEHDEAGAALAFIRRVTDGFDPPDWACPTFRGLYYGLMQLEADMHLHVHLENNVLFPRAARLALNQSDTGRRVDTAGVKAAHPVNN
jgi:regulator of cell morphogenesis and NO signaling